MLLDQEHEINNAIYLTLCNRIRSLLTYLESLDKTYLCLSVASALKRERQVNKHREIDFLEQYRSVG